MIKGIFNSLGLTYLLGFSVLIVYLVFNGAVESLACIAAGILAAGTYIRIFLLDKTDGS